MYMCPFMFLLLAPSPSLFDFLPKTDFLSCSQFWGYILVVRALLYASVVLVTRLTTIVTHLCPVSPSASLIQFTVNDHYFTPAT